MAFEGLNQAGHRKSDLVVVLNDNEFSISHNVGALSGYLNRIMTGRAYTSFRKRIERLLKAMPHGAFLARIAKKSEELTKGFIVPGILFEELGFTYVGPIPGTTSKPSSAPSRTSRTSRGRRSSTWSPRRGRGTRRRRPTPSSSTAWARSTRRPGKGPGRPRADLHGRFLGRHRRHRQGEPKVVAITAAMCSGTGLGKFREAFPDRFFDVGIAESHAVTSAAGLAREGKIPVVAIYSTFLQRAFDQVIHDVCLQNLPVVFAVDRGGVVGADGATHQGLFDLSFLREIPNMSVMAPRDEAELVRMLRTAVASGRPAAVRYPRGAGRGVPVPAEPGTVPWGKGSSSRTAATCCSSASERPFPPVCSPGGAPEVRGFRRRGRRTLREADGRGADPAARPPDRAGDHRRGERPRGGFGSAVLEMLDENDEHPLHFRRIGFADRFAEHGSPSEIREAFGVTAASVAEEALRICSPGKSVRPSLLYGIRSRREKIV